MGYGVFSKNREIETSILVITILRILNNNTKVGKKVPNLLKPLRFKSQRNRDQ